LIKHTRRSVTAVHNRPIPTAAVDRTDRLTVNQEELHVRLATAKLLEFMVKHTFRPSFCNLIFPK
jgi:hypothetical protein